MAYLPHDLVAQHALKQVALRVQQCLRLDLLNKNLPQAHCHPLHRQMDRFLGALTVLQSPHVPSLPVKLSGRFFDVQ